MGKLIESGLPCSLCDSSDAVSEYEQKNGTTNFHCFSCESHIPANEEETPVTPKITATKPTSYQLPTDLVTIGIPERRIAEKTCRFYGVKSKIVDGSETERLYPVYSAGVLTGYKKRVLPKDFTQGRYGTTGGEIELFGQHLFAPGKIVVVTAGEEDALAAFEITKYKSRVNRGLPCVSLPNGCCAKDIKNNLEWLDGFEKIVFAVDQEADKDLKKAKEFCKLFKPGKAYIAYFSENDASDMCKEGKFQEFYDSLWNAKIETPAGVIDSSKTWETWVNRNNFTSVPWPSAWGMSHFGELLRLGSLVTIGAGTGQGKTSLFKELEMHVFNTTDYNVGVIHLEESLADTVGGLMALECNKRLTLPGHGVTETDQRETWERLFASDRFVLDQAFGSLTGDGLATKIRYMANARGCKFIFLDHLSALTALYSSDRDGSKNEKTEKLVASLQMLKEELNICIVLVSHLRKRSDDSQSYENGAVPSLDALYGSSSLKNYSNVVLTIQRDQRVHNSPVYYHIVKNRLTGVLGKSAPIGYDSETGRLGAYKEPTLVVEGEGDTEIL